ncbi:hypothetical protein D3C80_359660 [compost metagenome]
MFGVAERGRNRLDLLFYQLVGFGHLVDDRAAGIGERLGDSRSLAGETALRLGDASDDFVGALLDRTGELLVAAAEFLGEFGAGARQRFCRAAGFVIHALTGFNDCFAKRGGETYGLAFDRLGDVFKTIGQCPVHGAETFLDMGCATIKCFGDTGGGIGACLFECDGALVDGAGDAFGCFTCRTFNFDTAAVDCIGDPVSGSVRNTLELSCTGTESIRQAAAGRVDDRADTQDFVADTVFQSAEGHFDTASGTVQRGRDTADSLFYA